MAPTQLSNEWMTQNDIQANVTQVKVTETKLAPTNSRSVSPLSTKHPSDPSKAGRKALKSHLKFHLPAWTLTSPKG
ncbi:hypothetical protein MGN70_008685 [Eutypa lata]|nr:hypothetical protein MGN70_008685 [Eutypa lata]